MITVAAPWPRMRTANAPVSCTGFSPKLKMPGPGKQCRRFEHLIHRLLYCERSLVVLSAVTQIVQSQLSPSPPNDGGQKMRQSTTIGNVIEREPAIMMMHAARRRRVEFFDGSIGGARDENPVISGSKLAAVRIGRESDLTPSSKMNEVPAAGTSISPVRRSIKIDIIVTGAVLNDPAWSQRLIRVWRPGSVRFCASTGKSPLSAEH